MWNGHRSFESIVYILLAFSSSSRVFSQKPDADEGWPRVHAVEGGQVVVYQPNIESWEDYTSLQASAAVQVIPTGREEGIYGAVEFEADSQVTFQSRMVLFSNVRISSLRFPGAQPDQAEACEGLLRQVFRKGNAIVISLDRVIAAMEISNLQHPAIEVNLDPPPIFYSQEPAILVMFLGDPKFETVPDNTLLFAVNTNWDLFLDPSSGNYYLLNEDSWLTTKDLEKSPWAPTKELPDGLSKLPDDDNWKNVASNVPGRTATDAPTVFVSVEPSEVIVTEGKPSYSPIPGTRLLEVTNTESDVFLHSVEDTHYFLTAGRWFRSVGLEGPWSAATEDLPEEFGKIPEDHKKGAVLASVPGAPEAEAAALLASIPKKAKVTREGTTLDVVYDGEPEFEEIETTEVSFAINTPEDVFKVDQSFYCCHQGIWFCSSDPDGPWVVCDSVPDEIYGIPADHPAHNVTYVYIYDSDPEEVTVGYTSGYTGSYLTGSGLLMFGLGSWLSYEYWDHRLDDYNRWHYGPQYYGYGCGARYDYNHGGYYRAAQYYGPYGGAGRGAVFNPATGTYARGAYRYGPRGDAYAKQAFNPYTDRYAAQARAKTPYGSWGRTVVSDGEDWAKGGHRSNARGTVVGGKTSEGAGVVAGRSRRTGDTGLVGKDKYGDVYLGKDGNLYKREGQGDWSKYSDGSWGNIQRDRAQTRQNLEKRGTEGIGRANRETRRPSEGVSRTARDTARARDPRSQTATRARNPQLDRSQVQTRQYRTSPHTGARTNVPQYGAAQQYRGRSGYSGQVQHPSSMSRSQLSRQYQSRQTGQARAQNYQRSRSSGGISRGGGASGGARRGGGRGRR